MPSPVADHFIRFAPSYDRVNHILSLGLDVRWRARLIAAIKERPNPRVLDLCAGTLACTREVLRRFPHAHVTAVDFCRPMLDIGLSRLPEPLRTRVRVICADALVLELAPLSFDVVICSCGMRHLPEQEAMLKKIRGWLLPEGQFIILDFFRPTTVVSKLFHSTAGRYLLPMVADLLKGFGPAYLNLYASIKHFSSRAEYERLLITQKFTIRRSEDLTFGIVSLIATAPLLLPDHQAL
jgi:demethylmenaquinone methyltransferase / 2-methoxy-6-polyprenyl-1,4-benzoquinol methylase